MSNPQIESNKAIFTWKGDRAPSLMGDFNHWDDETAMKLKPAGSHLWRLELELPFDTYLEYTFLVDDQRVLDPDNPHSVYDGVGHRNNYFSMPGMKTDPAAAVQQHPPAGFLTRHDLVDEYRLARPRRTLRLYHPILPGPHPLLVVYDGQDYLRKGRLVRIVNNLIAAGKISPLALALIDHAGPRRMVEYSCNDATISFILEKVLPLASQEMDLLDPRTVPGCHAVLGASMGGLMALYTALRFPQVFGKAFSQAGAFGFEDFDFSVYELVEIGPKRPVKIWLDVGRFDALAATNQRMHELLARKGYEVTYREFNGGHNYTMWRNSIVGELVEGFGNLQKSAIMKTG